MCNYMLSSTILRLLRWLGSDINLCMQHYLQVFHLFCLQLQFRQTLNLYCACLIVIAHALASFQFCVIQSQCNRSAGIRNLLSRVVLVKVFCQELLPQLLWKNLLRGEHVPKAVLWPKPFTFLMYVVNSAWTRNSCVRYGIFLAVCVPLAFMYMPFPYWHANSH